ncbi:MAG: hypothetical protein IJS51_00945 [Treponema sp.]|nr:hypothetical protein [Treponema sp.]
MANLKKFKEFTKYLDVKGKRGDNNPGTEEYEHVPDVDEHIYWYDLEKGNKEKAIIMGEKSESLWFYSWGNPNTKAGEKRIQAVKDAFPGSTVTRTGKSAYIRIGDISKCDIEKTSEKIKELLDK